jgi:phosphatidylcholine synthase
MVFAGLVFVPVKFIYPSRSPRFRLTINLFGALWGLAIVWILFTLPAPSEPLVIASLAFPAYYTALSFWLEFRRLITAAPPKG